MTISSVQAGRPGTSSTGASGRRLAGALRGRGSGGRPARLHSRSRRDPGDRDRPLGGRPPRALDGGSAAPAGWRSRLRALVRVAAAVAQSGVVDLAEETSSRSAAASRRAARRRPGGCGALRRRLARRARAARRAAAPRSRRARRHRAAAISEAYAERARAAGDRVELELIRGAAHFEHLDPALVLLARGSRLARRVSSSGPRPQRLDRDDALAPFRERFVHRRRRADLRDGNSLGRLPRHAGRARGLVADWGERLVIGLGGVDRAARRGRRPARRPRGRTDGGGARLRLDDREPLQARPRGARPAAARAIVVRRENFPTDRYVLEGVADRRGLELRLLDCDPLAGPQPDDVAAACAAGASASSRSRTSPTAPAPSPTWPESTRPPPTAARSSSGT